MRPIALHSQYAHQPTPTTSKLRPTHPSRNAAYSDKQTYSMEQPKTVTGQDKPPLTEPQPGPDKPQIEPAAQ